MVKSIAILRESKTDSKGREVENRVVLTPPLLQSLKESLLSPVVFFVERDAGAKIDFSNASYEAIGAKIITHAEALTKDLILGVKETNIADFSKLENNLWISFQHFAQSKERTVMALKTSQAKNVTFLTFETMQSEKENYHFFPCLAPMSEAAAKIVARHADEYALLTKKIITSGMPETGLHGVKAAIIGGGTAGKTAAEEFSERGCEVFLLEKNPVRLKYLVDYFRVNEIRFPKVKVFEISPENLKITIRDALFLVSTMYTSGKKPEKLISMGLLKTMMSGGCVYPIDIDQGGGVEGVMETSLLEPFDLPVIPGTEVFFYAPANLPSLGARTTSEVLGTVILPYLAEIINKGLIKAAEDNAVIQTGINIRQGKIVHPGLASVFPDLK